MCLSLLVPTLMRADFSDDVSYISKECLTALHYDHIKGSLLLFAKNHNLSDEEMTKRLLFIANPTNNLTVTEGQPTLCRVIGALCFFPNTDIALPVLEKYISIPSVQLEALRTYGVITKFDKRFLKCVKNARDSGALSVTYYQVELSSAFCMFLEGGRGVTTISGLGIERALVNSESVFFDQAFDLDRFLCAKIPVYSNSLEHVRAQEQSLMLLNKDRDKIVNRSCFRGEWGGGNVSNEEWYRRITNNCQSEIARVMSLPESQRVSMTAILDAQIAAIEEAEAWAVRRAIWRRRIRNAALLLPIPVFVLVVVLARRRRNR